MTLKPKRTHAWGIALLMILVTIPTIVFGNVAAGANSRARTHRIPRPRIAPVSLISPATQQLQQREMVLHARHRAARMKAAARRRAAARKAAAKRAAAAAAAAQAAQAAQSSQSSQSSSGGSGSPPAPQPGQPDWTATAACESGGNWSINTGNGYWGGLQFAPSTWFAYGGGPFNGVGPFPYSEADQIAVANRVLAAAGPGAWPVCFRWA